jgi:glycosyltransferase involved in cell wall biosynthesis
MNAVVSLGIPVFNGDAFLRGALESIVGQTFADLDIVIVDNASTDGTEDICRDFANRDARVRYHRHPKNIGAAPNFNHAFSLSRSPYFKWCAHDDLISPNFVERCVAALEARPDAVLAFGRTEVINDDGNHVDWPEKGFMPPLESDGAAQRFGAAIRQAGTCFPIFGLFRSDALRRSTLHRPYYGSDRALIAEAALLGKVLLVGDAVFYNRHHGKRSIVMKDHAARRAWQSAKSSRKLAGEHLGYTKHLLEIAARHGDAGSKAAALAEVSKTRLAPRYLPRYALDVLRFVSPSAAATLRDAWTTAFRRNDRVSDAPPPKRTSHSEEPS